jgi:hypothetical protein
VFSNATGLTTRVSPAVARSIASRVNFVTAWGGVKQLCPYRSGGRRVIRLRIMRLRFLTEG